MRLKGTDNLFVKFNPAMCSQSSKVMSDNLSDY